MKKMKKFVVICGLMVVIAWQSQNLIVETMRIVDFYGEKTNTNVVEIIDKLNDDINIKHAINKTFFLINLLLENYSKINYELLIFYLILTYL